MDLSHSPEQDLFRESVREFVRDRLPDDRLAEIADGAEGWDPALWKEAASLGLAGVSVPEDLGGAGMGFVEEAIVAEELGRGVFPGPWLGTVPLAQPLIAQDPDLLRAVAAGERIATLVSPIAGVVAEGSSLTGSDRYVVDGGAADVLVVAAFSGSGHLLFTVDRDEAEWRPLRTVDGTRRLAEVAFHDTPARPMASSDRAATLIRRAAVRGLAALASEAVGVASRAVDLAVEHARAREQFGRAIGTFQAVSHQIVDSYMDAENARSLAAWAAAALDADDPEAPLAATTAERFAADAAVRACERAIQIHGGIGFTWEHVLHRLYKRALWIRAWAPILRPSADDRPR